MAQLEALEFLKKPSPVSESILEQTDKVFPPIDDKKEAFIEQQATPFDEKESAVDMPVPVHTEEKKEILPDIKTELYSDITLESIKSTDVSELQQDQISDDLLYANQSLLLKDEETEYDFFHIHPAGDIAEDLPQVFQQEFFDHFYKDMSDLEQGMVGLTDYQEPGLGTVHMGELYVFSATEGIRKGVQELLDYSAYLSPLYGGDAWWNGFGKGGKSPLQLPHIQTPGGMLDKSIQLVAEYFAPAGYAVKGTKLASQLMTGVKDIAKWKGKFSRGEDIGAFAVGFGAVDMALVDPNMKNLAAMIKDYPKLEGPIGWFLDKMATDPNNPEWQNRFVRTIEGMGIGFTLESALWLTKVVTHGIAQGTIHVIKPLDQDLFKFMKTNVPGDITIAQYMWGTLKEFNPLKYVKKAIHETADDTYALRLIEGEVEGVMPSVMTMRHPALLKEFERLRKLPENKGLPDDQLRAQAEINVGKVGSGGKSAWVEFKLLKNAGRVIDNWFNHGTSTWRSLDEAGEFRLDYGKLETTGPGFAKSLSEFITTPTQLKDFMYYLVSKRALKLKERGFKPKEILQNWDQKMLEKYQRLGDANPAFKGALKNLQGYNKRLMDFAVDSGLITREAADKMLKANPVYVPFYRVTETLGIDGILKTEIQQATRKNPVNLFTGGGGMIGDPYQSLLKNTAVIVEAALRNRANQTLGYYIEKVMAKRIKIAQAEGKRLGYKGDKLKQFVKSHSTEWAQPMTAKDAAGYAKIDYPNLIKQLEKEGFKINVDDVPTKDYIKLFHFNNKNIRTDKGELIFVANFDGKAKYYKITDEMLKTAVDSFGWKSFEYQNWVMRTLAKSKGTVSWLITRDPSFAMYANPVRDSWGGAINSSAWNRIPVLDTGAGVLKMWSYYWGKNPQNHKLVLDYLNNGGGFGTIFTKNAEQHSYHIKKYFNKHLKVPLDDVVTNPTKFFKMYGDFVGSFEHATRVREFQKLLKLGYNEREAAVMAREISIDFSMKGANNLMTGINQATPFFNPAVQGAYKSMRTWFGEGRFMKTFIQTNMYVGAPSAYLWYLNHGNPDYQAYPDWAKRQAWFIPAGKRYDENLGREVTRFILVPKPFDLYGMYANAMEAGLQTWWEAVNKSSGSDIGDIVTEEWIKMMFGNIKHALPPIPMPPIASIGFALFGNVDTFTGANIIPKRLENVPDEFQYTPFTSETMIALGQWTGISPLRLEAMYEKQLAGLGEYFLHGVDYFTNYVTEGQWDSGLPVTLEDIPILDRAYENGIPTISQQEIEMYDKIAEGLDDYISTNMLTELLFSDEERVTAWLNNEDNRDKIMQRPVFLNYLMENGKINGLIRKLHLTKDISSDSKNRQIIQLQDKKRKIANEYLDLLESMRNK